MSISHLGARKKWIEKVPIFEGDPVIHRGALKKCFVKVPIFEGGSAIHRGTLKKWIRNHHSLLVDEWDRELMLNLTLPCKVRQGWGKGSAIN